MGKTELDEIYRFKTRRKIQLFDVSIGIKIPYFRVLVTIEPGRSLLQFVATNCLKTTKKTTNKHVSVFFLLAKIQDSTVLQVGA